MLSSLRTNGDGDALAAMTGYREDLEVCPWVPASAGIDELQSMSATGCHVAPGLAGTKVKNRETN